MINQDFKYFIARVFRFMINVPFYDSSVVMKFIKMSNKNIISARASVILQLKSSDVSSMNATLKGVIIAVYITMRKMIEDQMNLKLEFGWIKQ